MIVSIEHDGALLCTLHHQPNGNYTAVMMGLDGFRRLFSLNPTDVVTVNDKRMSYQETKLTYLRKTTVYLLCDSGYESM